MHIQITDFGSAKILKDTKGDEGQLVLGPYPNTPVVFAVTIPTPLCLWGHPSLNPFILFWHLTEAPVSGRTTSFVGTAQYVSPEILTSKKAYYR